MSFLSGIHSVLGAPVKGLNKFLSLGESEGEAPQFIDPELAVANQVAAERAANLRGELQRGQEYSLGGYTQALNQLKGLPSAATVTNTGIENALRNQNIQGNLAEAQLGRSLGARGNGNSVSGLKSFLSLANRNQNAANQLEYGRAGSEMNIGQQDLARRGGLLGGVSNVLAGADLPSTQFMTPGKEGTQGILPGGLGAVGGILGGIYGGPAGAAGGNAAGQAVGTGISGAYQRRQYKPTYYG